MLTPRPLALRAALCLCASVCPSILGTSSELEAQIYDSGTILTAPLAGFAGADVSQLENVPPLNLTVFGFNADQGGGFSIADDFTVCGTWAITNLEFFAYQTGGVGSVITGVFVRIWDRDPRETGAVTVWPGLPLDPFSANLLPGTDVFDCYRTVFAPTLAVNREVRKINVPVLIALPTGVYWIEVQFTGSALLTGPWVPPITTLGCPKTGNAIQRNNAGTYSDLVTGGTNGVGLPWRAFGVALGGSTAAASTYGAGSAGMNGVGAWVLGDAAVTVRKPVLGSCYPLRLEKGVTGQVPFVLLGTSACTIPIPCATLLVCPTFLAFQMPAFDANFESMLCVPIPHGFWLCGVQVALQAFWLDSTIGCGYAHSNGLLLTLGD